MADPVSKKPRRDWYSKTLLTAALGMLVKGNAKIDEIDVRLARVETAVQFLAPAPKYSLILKPQASQAGFGLQMLQSFFTKGK